MLRAWPFGNNISETEMQTHFIKTILFGNDFNSTIKLMEIVTGKHIIHLNHIISKTLSNFQSSGCEFVYFILILFLLILPNQLS